MGDPPPIPKRKRGPARTVIAWVLFALVAGGLLTYTLKPYKVPTEAMSPTLQGSRSPGSEKGKTPDHIWVNKLAYGTKDPQRGDVVVFETKAIQHPQVRQNTVYIKRVVGLPGETISIKPPRLVVDGEELREPDIFADIIAGTNGFGGYRLAHRHASIPAVLSSPEDQLTLSEDEFLLLGDNSHNSLDGRYFGPVNRDAIQGKAFRIYYPLHRAGPIR